MKKFITIKTVYEATHNWPDCDIEEVSYLKNEHRHQFYITCSKEVNHNDRDIEIIQFKKAINEYLGSYGGKLGSISCEELAERLIKEFHLSSCKVLEDNENGAILII
jgi:hypothetical protein